jgi:hypothetical protein
VSQARWSIRTHRVLNVLSGLLMLGAVARLAFGGDLLWVDRVLPSWWWLFSGSLLLKSAESNDRQRGRPVRWVPTALAVVAGTVLAGGLVLAWVHPSERVDAVESPDARLTAVVTEGAAMIDPVWHLTVRQNRGLLSRQWDIGCLNGDDPANAYESLTWTSPTTIEVRTGGGERLPVDLADDGRPLDRVAVGTSFC